MTIQRRQQPPTIRLEGAHPGDLLNELGDTEPWMRDGLCAQTDPEAFYPEKGGSSREAKAVCGRCPVTEECLAYALATEQRYGIWGGHSERERRKLARQRRGPS